jgi:superfamily II DNA or RNA helicase
MSASVHLTFHAGTLEVRGADEGSDELAELTSGDLTWDKRTRCYRAPAARYRDVVAALVRGGVALDDKARAWPELRGRARVRFETRDYQAAALTAWRKASSRGVVVLPTGAGKTHVGVRAIEDKARAALVIAPTLDLVRQWYDLLGAAFGGPIGVLGGGEHDVQPITVSTYDSAWMRMDHLGDRFGTLVFDEVHHLPGESYALAARLSLAPFRLGLTATPERVDGRHDWLSELVGPVVYRREITDLAGDFLADYETETVEVDLSEEEREVYEEERARYLSFVRERGLRVGGPGGWDRFVRAAAGSDEGARAMTAYRRQRDLARAASAKLDVTARLIDAHRHDRTIVFTDDNATAYRLARELLLPIITHQTKVKERSEILARFADGTYGAVVTSRVLNEGIDVPDANVAIVVSGTGSVREHVQRLGRILRPREGKRALLYELVSRDTAEASTSERRRDHVAYR